MLYLREILNEDIFEQAIGVNRVPIKFELVGIVHILYVILEKRIFEAHQRNVCKTSVKCNYSRLAFKWMKIMKNGAGEVLSLEFVIDAFIGLFWCCISLRSDGDVM
jgi:hypothetical protein